MPKKRIMLHIWFKNSGARCQKTFVTISMIADQVPVDSDGKQIGFDTSTIKIAERLTGLVSGPELPGCCSAVKR